MLPSFLSQRHSIAIHSSAIRFLNQPRLFTRILKPVQAYAHLLGVKLHMYLDDWLLNPGSRQEAREQSSWLSSLCQRLGLVIHLDMSDWCWTPVTRLSHKRVTNWLSLADGFTAQQLPPAVQWLQGLGHLVSLEKLMPYGRIRIRPLQWQLGLHWNQRD